MLRTRGGRKVCSHWGLEAGEVEDWTSLGRRGPPPVEEGAGAGCLALRDTAIYRHAGDRCAPWRLTKARRAPPVAAGISRCGLLCSNETPQAQERVPFGPDVVSDVHTRRLAGPELFARHASGPQLQSSAAHAQRLATIAPRRGNAAPASGGPPIAEAFSARAIESNIERTARARSYLRRRSCDSTPDEAFSATSEARGDPAGCRYDGASDHRRRRAKAERQSQSWGSW